MLLMGKSTIFMAIFNSKLLNYQKVIDPFIDDFPSYKPPFIMDFPWYFMGPPGF